MSSILRRLKKLEESLTDPSGLAPNSQKWLEYWDRQISTFITDPEGRRPAVPFPLGAFRAVMKYMSSSASLVGSIPGIDE